MKTGFLVGGIVLLVVGFFVFWQGYSVIQYYNNTSIGQFNLAISEQARQQYLQAQNYALFGGIISLIGIGVTIYGAIAKPNVQQTQQPMQPAPPSPTG